jgi:uncharacterized iron-regulated protein
MTPARLSSTISLVFLAFLTACGGAAPRAETPTPTRDPLLGTFLDAEDRVVPLPEVLARLEAARVVYLGETHDDPANHALQAALVEALYARDPSLGLGLEMVQRPFQPVLDEYVAGSLDETQLLSRLGWDERWGYDFAFYRPFFDLARAHRLPLRALNARSELTRRIGREGLDALTPEERAELPETDTTDAEHRAMVMAMLGDHPGLDDTKRERFYAAQLVWDETMAEEVARTLAAPDAPRHFVVLAGTGHVARGLGIPKRAARRGATPFIVVLPADACDSPADADLRWRP